MSANSTHPLVSTRTLARLAGVLYLVIVCAGVWSEAVVRSNIFVAGDAAETARRLTASADLYRLAFATDAAMVVSDVLLGLLLFWLLRPAGPLLAAMALAFRLTQAAILGMNLLTHSAALLVLTRAELLTGFTSTQLDGLASLLMEAQAQGYDIGLVFFGVNCLLTGALLVRSPAFPSALGWLVGAAGPVYLIGSGLRFLWPAAAGAFAAAYLVPLVAESAFCLWLLLRGVRPTGS